MQLRRVCRISGVQVSFEPKNTGDSFYRTSIDFVLNACSRCLSIDLYLLNRFYLFVLWYDSELVW